MKKTMIIAAGAILLTSCGSTGSGALTGAFFGELIGSAIGGIAGGPRGSDVGSLIGMAVGAGTGAAIGAANEESREEIVSTNTYRPSRSEHHTSRHAIKYQCSNPQIEIENARFINADNTLHIGRGEVVQISYEIRNTTGEYLHDIVADVDETTGNRHLTLSEPIRIETIAPHKAVRYTVSITASQALKKGKAHYVLFTTSKGKTTSNPVEFDIPLN